MSLVLRPAKRLLAYTWIVSRLGGLRLFTNKCGKWQREFCANSCTSGVGPLAAPISSTLHRKTFQMQVNLLDWYFELPIITRVYFTGAFATTALCSLDLISPFHLYYSSAAIGRGELWRLVTNFLYFGNIGIDFLFHMYFVCVLEPGHVQLNACEATSRPTCQHPIPPFSPCAASDIADR